MSFVSTPTNKTISETETVTFSCNAAGNPTPTIKWLNDGHIVGTGNTLSFQVLRNQSGYYLCSADNELNVTVNASAYLEVHCKYGISQVNTCTVLLKCKLPLSRDVSHFLREAVKKNYRKTSHSGEIGNRNAYRRPDLSHEMCIQIRVENLPDHRLYSIRYFSPLPALYSSANDPRPQMIPKLGRK